MRTQEDKFQAGLPAESTLLLLGLFHQSYNYVGKNWLRESANNPQSLLPEKLIENNVSGMICGVMTNGTADSRRILLVLVLLRR